MLDLSIYHVNTHTIFAKKKHTHTIWFLSFAFSFLASVASSKRKGKIKVHVDEQLDRVHVAHAYA